MATQLQRLAKPFPKRLVKKAPQGKYGTYASHDSYNQALLAIVGPFSFRIVQVLRRGGVVTSLSQSPASAPPQIEGCIGELTVTVDGKEVTVQEVGDCEQPSNWKTDGARLKDASSDAFKRCCMRLGLGLHLWAQDDYILHDLLSQREGEEAGT